MSHANPYQIKWTVEKYSTGGLAIPSLTELEGDLKPYERVEIDSNMMLNQGRDLLNNMLMGSGSPTPLSAANALVHVGNSSLAEAKTQTELQAAGVYNDTSGTPMKWKKGMESGFPQVVNGAIRYKARFLSAEANFAWNEFGVSNGTLLFNRKVASPSIGTKTVEDEWVFSVELNFV
ncbi:hypothetical protein Dxin01_00174 [Deinococcus xinjiangensis]|uniref:Uncharacterized protein n=1 Tax=Deinococcus xinjiangensis TaxID=457454 RepID=A0ABP9VB08_9DEIO